MKACTARPAFHIAMPASGMVMNEHGFRSGDAFSTPETSLPHTPLPFDMGDFMYHGSLKRTRDDDDELESLASYDGFEDVEKWQSEELQVVHSILHNPLQPLNSPFPPATLPPPQALDELTHQITSISVSPSASPLRRGAKEWQHSIASTRAKVFEMALKESQGLTLLPGGGGWARPRPSVKRVGSMDFLMEGEQEDEVEKGRRALELSSLMQEKAKSRSGPLSFDAPSLQSTPAPTTSVLIPSMTVTPSSPVASSPPTSKRSARPGRPSYTRRPSLLQRGRSFTASDLASEDGQDILDDVAAPLVLAPVEPMTPTKRLTRSQSMLFPASAPAPKALTKAFLAPKEPSTVGKMELCKPLELKPALTPPEQPRKRVRRHGLALSPLPLPLPLPLLPRVETDGLSSPFEERTGLSF